MEGMKFDNDKNRLELVHWPFVEDIGRVLTYGAGKYAANNWQVLSEAEDRYFAAAMRHLLAWRAGEIEDPETGLNHLAHVATNLMFLHYFGENHE